MGDEMARFFRRQLEVKTRVERIIDERTGEMREMRDTVTLQRARSRSTQGHELGCLCTGQLGDCPRDELMYWREVWLDRIDGSGDQGSK
jgi:gamma-glutamyl:cysteine ligase YbdK (ATP-grasp superfamily)